ncbi:hypothetical protein N7478_002170 [Penicillium angulare]|uniref:uncharacterized protein n=1 Tax=Penicillium angulare TaxID=116970 RepID=UPI002541AF89|nr:uncharacterized protein N7478_002170 [Penicillium angulare]KAJ5289140.1 hypothetical protein N7478_002170 [Penicillium angulare]
MPITAASPITKLWEDYELSGDQPDSKVLTGVVHDIICNIEGSVYLVFDALDECPEATHTKERRSLLALLMGLLERHKDKVHILATRRREYDIEQKLAKSSKLDLEAHLAEDVKTFVSQVHCGGPSEQMKAQHP